MTNERTSRLQELIEKGHTALYANGLRIDLVAKVAYDQDDSPLRELTPKRIELLVEFLGKALEAPAENWKIGDRLVTKEELKRNVYGAMYLAKDTIGSDLTPLRKYSAGLIGNKYRAGWYWKGEVPRFSASDRLGLPSTSESGTRSPRAWFLFSLALGVALVAAVYWISSDTTKPDVQAKGKQQAAPTISVKQVAEGIDFDDTSVAGKRIVVRDSLGNIEWTLFWPDADLSRYNADFRSSLLHDINGDGQRELLILRESMATLGKPIQLACYTRDGQQCWDAVALGGSISRRGTILVNNYDGEIFEILERKRRSYVLVGANQSPRYPSQLALIDLSNGELVSQHWHPGHLKDHVLADLDDDGNEELLIAACNNPEDGVGHTGLLVLDVPFENHPWDFEDTGITEHGQVRDYLTFYRPDVFENIQQVPCAEAVFIERGNVVVRSWEVSMIYHLDLKLWPQRVLPSDAAVRIHRDLALTAELDHRLDQAERTAWGAVLRSSHVTDGNDARLEAAFDACVQGNDPTVLQELDLECRNLSGQTVN